MSYDDENQACVCTEENYKATVFDHLGFELNNIQCVPCPPGELLRAGGTQTQWECIKCPDVNMILNEGSNCQCKTGFVNAGDTCVPESERKALADNEWIIEDFQNRVTYYDLWNQEAGALSSEDPRTVVSDVFDYLYIQSAVGCMNDGDP